MMRFLGRDTEDDLLVVFNVLQAYEQDNKAFLVVLSLSEDGETEISEIRVFCNDVTEFLLSVATQDCLKTIYNFEWVYNDDSETSPIDSF